MAKYSDRSSGMYSGRLSGPPLFHEGGVLVRSDSNWTGGVGYQSAIFIRFGTGIIIAFLLLSKRHAGYNLGVRRKYNISFLEREFMKSACRTWALVVLAGLFFTAGCGLTDGFSKNSVTTSNGIPSERWRVGGGFDISYTVPMDGIVYLVDQKSSRFLITESVEEGYLFTFKIDS